MFSRALAKDEQKEMPFGDWRNWLAHMLWEHGVVGSSPTSPTILKKSTKQRYGVIV